MATSLDTILGFLTGKGLTPAQAAGVAGNWQVESGLNPAARNPREGAVGIAQWEGGRRSALDAYAARTGGSETDLTTQLNFAWSELTGSESGALHRLLATNDPASAAAVVDQYYERSAGTSRTQRIADAQAIAAGAPAGAASTSTTGGGVETVGAQNVGLFTGWADDVYGIALKVGGGVIAGALVIVGLHEAMKGSSS